MEQDLRCFTFGNFMLSSIQQGIQGAHAIAEMFVNYPTNCNAAHILYDWAENHKTIVAKNAGNEEDVRSIVSMLSVEENRNPWCAFTESKDALSESVTCVAVVLPYKLYHTGVQHVKNKYVQFKYHENIKLWIAKDETTGYTTEYTQHEFDIIHLLNNTHLAR